MTSLIRGALAHVPKAGAVCPEKDKVFWGGTPANNWDLQCREGRILRAGFPLFRSWESAGEVKISSVLVGWGHRQGV